MAKKLKTYEKRAIEHYCDQDNKETYLNWCESYKQAGYSTCKGWKTNACRVHNKNYIKAAIDDKMAVIEKNKAITREYCTLKLQDIVENSKVDRDKMTAISLLGDFQGFKRDLAPNSEREAALLAKMSDEDKLILEELALLRVRKMALRPVKAG